MNISLLGRDEREDQISELFNAVKLNPFVSDELAANMFADYIGLVTVYERLGYTLILDKLLVDQEHQLFLNGFVNPENTVTVLMAIHNYII